MQSQDETPKGQAPADPTEEILYSPAAAASPDDIYYPPAPEPSPDPVPLAAPVAPKRSTAGALIAVAFVASTVAGGLVGGLAGSQWLAPRVAQTPAPAVETESPTATGTSPTQVAETTGMTVASTVYAKTKNGVVHIVVAGGGSGRGNGSGFVVDERGYILTNQHVIANARAITIRFASGETRQATVIGTDRANDIALLQVDLPEGVTPLTLGDSDQVQVGEIAVAIGSPFGLSQTVTQGIISAVDRSWQPGNSAIREDLIQTDAPINPGNSGGPLLNAAGEVIGINSMIESPVEGSVGIGFAVAINVAKDLMPALQTGAAGTVPVWLGISGIAIDQTVADDLDLDVSSGILVQNVVPNGPAAKAGVRGGQAESGGVATGGDIIIEVDGAAVASVQQLSTRLQAHKPGDTVALTIIRNGERISVNVTLEVWPETN
jgi:serine protease Do